MCFLKSISNSECLLRVAVLATGCLGLGLGPLGREAAAQSSLQEWEAKAVMEFPELGIQDSPFNRLFLEKAALLKEKSPQSLGDPSWPYRLASRIAEHPELLRPALGGAIGQGESGGEFGPGIAELCVKAIKRRVSVENAKEKLADWISGERVINARRAMALLEADASTPELRPALAAWVRKMQLLPGHNSEEDRLWLQAFLSAEKLQEPVAALVGQEVVEFQFRLLGETESMEFAEVWLSGKPSPFREGSHGLTAGRVRVLEKVVRNRFQLGGLAIPEFFCLETFYAYESVNPGEGFLLLDQFPVVQWPEKILMGSKLPLVRFNAQKKEWVNYLSRVMEISSWMSAGRAVSMNAWGKDEVRPGALDQYVLWKSRRMDSAEDTLVWLESLAVQFGKHPSAVVRDLRRVFPALAYVVKGEAQKAATQ